MLIRGVLYLFVVLILGQVYLLSAYDHITYPYAEAEYWYFDDANSTFGTVSYKLYLPPSVKNYNTFFVVNTVVTSTETFSNTLCTEILTPISNYSPQHCYPDTTVAAQSLCVNLGDPAWQTQDHVTVLIDCDAQEEYADCEMGIAYRVIFSYSDSCTTEEAYDNGGDAITAIIIAVIAGICCFCIIAAVLFYICMVYV